MIMKASADVMRCCDVACHVMRCCDVACRVMLYDYESGRSSIDDMNDLAPIFDDSTAILREFMAIFYDLAVMLNDLTTLLRNHV